MAREYIDKIDSLNDGREKLNKSIDRAYDADEKSDQSVTTSNKAETTAQNAEDKADSIQQQFNQVVIEGDSSVEAAQARVGADGTTYPVLKDRLDGEHEKVTAQLAHLEDDKASEKDVFLSNYTPAIELHLTDFSGYNQPYHPSVIDISGGFAGYDYWMVQSPFPVGAIPYRDRWECPVVHKSHDGVNWINVADPLDDLTPEEIARGDYFSDPHMTYREDLGRIEVWYRLTRNAGSTLPTKMLRKWTTDGENWSEREELIPEKLHTASDFVRSQSVRWDSGINRYRMWYQNNYGIYYNESLDGKTWDWGNQIKLNLDIPHDTWHIDVSKYRGQHHLLSYSMKDNDIRYYVSDNNIDYRFVRTLLSTNEGHPLWEKGLYRAVSLEDRDGKVRVYFSATNHDNKTRIGLIVADSIEDMQPLKRIPSENVLLNDGVNLQNTINQLKGNVEDTSSYAIVYNGGNVTLRNNENDPVTFDTIQRIGNVDFVEISESGNIRFTKPGHYMLNTKAVYDTNPDGIRVLRVGNFVSRTGALELGQTIIDSVTLFVAGEGDTIQVRSTQTSGGSLSVVGGAYQTSIRIKRI